MRLLISYSFCNHLFSGEELLGNPRLKVNAAALLEDIPVLPRTELDKICDKFDIIQIFIVTFFSFINLTKEDMKKWLEKTLSTEKDDWYKYVKPEEDNFQYFYTSMPNILFGMLRDTVSNN